VSTDLDAALGSDGEVAARPAPGQLVELGGIHIDTAVAGGAAQRVLLLASREPQNAGPPNVADRGVVIGEDTARRRRGGDLLGPIDVPIVRVQVLRRGAHAALPTAGSSMSSATSWPAGSPQSR